MSILPLLLTIVTIHLVALITPGPDFFFVSQVSASQGRAAGLKGTLGIALGIVFWAGLALLGLDILFQKAPWLQRAIMCAGGLYLLYLTYLLLKSALQHKPAAALDEPRTGQIRHVFLKGLLTNLSNPKAVIFFSSIFSAFVVQINTPGLKWFVLAIIVLETFLWFAIVAFVFSMPIMQKAYHKSGQWIDGCAGALFGGFGLYLIYSAIKHEAQATA